MHSEHTKKKARSGASNNPTDHPAAPAEFLAMQKLCSHTTPIHDKVFCNFSYYDTLTQSIFPMVLRTSNDLVIITILQSKGSKYNLYYTSFRVEASDFPELEDPDRSTFRNLVHPKRRT